MPRWLPRVLARIHRLAADGKVRFTEKAAEELEALELGLDELDARDVISGLSTQQCVGRVFSRDLDEWLYVFKPRITQMGLYVKLVLRTHCVVVSFHEERDDDAEE